MAATVLVVEDEHKLRDFIRSYLERVGFTVLSTGSGAEAITMATDTAPDLVVLDLGLPDVPGETVARELRAMSAVPILMLTAKAAEEDRIRGLELGADDYVTKPFSPRELLARVKALLRRAEPPSDAPRTIEIGKLAIDPASYRVSHSGKPVPLSTLEFRLLYYLASRPNRVFTRDQLLDAVWGTDRFVTPRSVDVYVRRLREKVESDPENPVHLKTVRGAGYLFETRAA